jgi:hypothetical protein
LNWTKFKKEYLFHLNATLMEAAVLYSIRRDFKYHWVLVLWLLLCLMSKKLRERHLQFFKILGFINTRLILGSFYFFFFTPFSVFYRLFFKKAAFETQGGRVVKKETISSFDQPF